MEGSDDRATQQPDDDAGALIGLDVGGYVVERELGRGGMGVVYAATHPMIGKRAAVKVLKHALSKSPATVERFLQEARSVNQIGHPNIVDIFAFGTLPDGRSYLVMDLLQGEPLRKRVKRGAIPVNETVRLLEELASGLMAAHEKGFIHRDLKPDNVFLVENPTRLEVKILDFGLAKLMPTATLDRAYRTATGAMIGTPDYMSPEQLRGSGVDHRTDIYALGVMAFEMLTRSRPHRFSDGTFDLEGLTFKQALLAIPGVPEQLADLIEAMIDPKPDQRPTLTAVRAVLKRVRPSLPAMPALSGVRAVGSELSLGAFGASNLGAKPVLPTPPTGAQTVKDGPPSAAMPYGGASQPPQYSGVPYSLAAASQPSMPPQAAPHVGAGESAPAMWAQPLTATQAMDAQPTTVMQAQAPPVMQPPMPPMPPMGHSAPPTQPPMGHSSPAIRPPQQPSQPPPMGLRSPERSSPHLATKLGVAPARNTQRPHPVAAARRQESRAWLFVGLVLVVVSAFVLTVVLVR